MIQDFHKKSIPKNQVKIIYIDTGFASCSWLEHVRKAETYAGNLGFETLTIHAKIKFSEAVLGRNEFPSPKFQWCATLLKGLPLLDFLDEIDRSCQAIICIGKRRESLPTLHQNLPEWIEKSEHFNDRMVWHPILDLTLNDRDDLIKAAGFQPLYAPSNECYPCVNSSQRSLASLSLKEIEKVKMLEHEVNKNMFENASIENVVTEAQKRSRRKIQFKEILLKEIISEETELFYRGCGNHFGCGV